MPVTREQVEAVPKARQLLERLLTPAQLADYRRSNHTLVAVRTAMATYQISAHSIVIAQRDGREIALCIQFAHPADGAWLPAEDLMIAKLLLIRTDEEGLWKRFGPPPYGPLQDHNINFDFNDGRMRRGGYVFGRGELYGTAQPGPPVHFTDELVPYNAVEP
jgi:hypothetical protein